jgi:WD40 repeat protein
VDGDSIKFFSKTAFGDAIGSEQPGGEYIAKRGDEDWLTHSINPEQASGFYGIRSPSSYVGLSPDLSKGVFFGRTPVGSGHPNVKELQNMYLRTDLQSPGAGSYELLSDAVSPLEALKGESVEPTIMFDGASADWSHILFETYGNLTGDTSGLDPTLPKLYEWHDGVVTYAGVLPDSACETPPCIASESVGGSGAGVHAPSFGGSEEHSFEEGWTTNSISADGSRIVFEANPVEEIYESSYLDAGQTFGNLYMRIGKASTVQLNASERAVPDPRGDLPARFLAATSDDSKVFFETAEALTNDAEMPENNLYMYEISAPVGKRLTLITVDQETNPAGAPRVVSVPEPAISEDGNFIYFLSDQSLMVNQPAVSGAALYVWHTGTLRFVAGHEGSKSNDPKWGDSGVSHWAPDEFRMSANGRKIAFASDSPSVAEQAGVPSSGELAQIYVYDYDTEKVTCASCNPSGELPTSRAQFETRTDATLATPTQYLSNAISRDGRFVFFDTGDPLVSQDTNGTRDVYEFDTVAGEIHLLSDGACDCNATFTDATPDGSNVFFTTRQQLVRMDVDNNTDLYDVRVNGGIPAQNAVPPVPCDGEECRGPARGAPVFSTPSSASFAGAGNSKGPVSKVQVKRKRPTLAQALRECKRKPTKMRRARCRARVRKAYRANRATRVQASRRAGR